MRNRVVALLVLIAAAWSVALLVGAATYPMYSGTRVSVDCPGCPPITSATATQTLLEVNGPPVLIVIAAPLLVSVLVAVSLWLRRRAAYTGAWVLLGLFWLLTLLAMFSVGVFFAPAALLLTTATALARRHDPVVPGR